MTTFVPAEMIGHGGYTLCMTYQIFIFCWQGNELYLQVIYYILIKLDFIYLNLNKMYESNVIQVE